jgi:hypothetical protein
MSFVAMDRIGPPSGVFRRRAALSAALFFVAALALGGGAHLLVVGSDRTFIAPSSGVGREAHHETAHAAPANDANVTLTGDTLTIVAPAGAFDRIAAGGHDLDLPPVLRLRVGQTIVIRNDDRLAHILLGEVVEPGQTVRRTLTAPGIEVYAAGCAAHASGTGMTSLIVSPAKERS